MQKLFWRLFPPYEVKLTVEEARAFLSQFDGACRSTIEPEVISLVRDAGKTVYSVRVDRMKPDQLALLLITNVIGRRIGSGAHHTYRATLSMTGRDLLKVWHSAQNTMKSRGYATAAELAEDNQWIREQIKGAG